MTRTMGVDQVPGGLDVAVLENGDEVIFGGRLTGADMPSHVLTLVGLAKMYEVQRGLIDPHPDDTLAATIIRALPEVFSIEVSSGGHNAASLATVAYRRLRAMADPLPVAPDAPVQVVTLNQDEDEPNRVTVGVYVPPGEPTPTHAIVPLARGYEMERPDGSKVVEHQVGLHEIGVTAALPPQTMGARQVWSLAPTTKLPTQGWTLVVSIYDGTGALIHEQALTEGQLLGMANLVPEATVEVAKWLETPGLNAGPYTARFEIFAGQASVYVNNSVVPSSDPSGFAAAVHDTGVDVSEWIDTNAVDVEAANPGINLPSPDPFAIPDIAQDTYDYPLGG